MTYTFSRLSKIDALAIARLQFESWRATYRGVLADAYIDGAMEQDLQTVWADWHDDKLVVGAVAEDGTLAGFAAYLMSDPVYLDNFHVETSLHGTGLAMQLFQAGVDEIAREGGTRLWLTVLDSNARARAFYKRLGGHEHAVQEDEMLGTKVQAIPVHWYDLTGFEQLSDGTD